MKPARTVAHEVQNRWLSLPSFGHADLLQFIEEAIEQDRREMVEAAAREADAVADFDVSPDERDSAQVIAARIRALAPVEPTPRLCPSCEFDVKRGRKPMPNCPGCLAPDNTPAPPPAVTCATWCGTDGFQVGADDLWFRKEDAGKKISGVIAFCTEECRDAGLPLHPAAQPKCGTCRGTRTWQYDFPDDRPSLIRPCPACSPGGER